MEEVDSWTVELDRKTNEIVLIVFMKDGDMKTIPAQTLIESYFMLMELERETSAEEQKARKKG